MRVIYRPILAYLSIADVDDIEYRDQSMSPGSRKPSALVDWLKALWAPIASFFLTAIGIFEFVKRWQDERVTVSIVVAALSIAIIIASLWYFGFSKKRRWSKVDQKYHEVHRFSNHYKLARGALAIIFAIGMVGAGIIYRQIKLLDGKVVILITNLKGPDPDKYLVNEKLYRQIHESFVNYSDVVVLMSSKNISEQDGSEVARYLGKTKRADLVLWGYYGVTETDVLITLHVENLGSGQINVPLTASAATEMKVAVDELNSFTIQQKLADQMTALVYFLTGMVRYQHSKYQDAAELFTKALTSPDWAEKVVSRGYVLLNRGYCALHLNQPEKAMEDFTAAINMQPNIADFYLARASLYKSLKSYDEAFKDANTAIEISPNNAEPYVNRGKIYERLGQFDNALSDINYAIKLEPENPSLYGERAWINAEADDLTAAYQDLDHAIELDPYAYSLYEMKGAIHINHGNYAEAIKDLNKAIRLQPDSSELYNNRGVAYADLDNFEKACKDFRKAIRLEPDYDLPHHGLSACYIREGDLQAALKEMDLAIGLSSPYIDQTVFLSYERRAQIYVGLHDYPKAILDLTEAIKLAPDTDMLYQHAELYAERARVYETIGDRQSAISDYRQVIVFGLDPKLKLAAEEALNRLGAQP